VVLDTAAQSAVWHLGAQAPELRAALAARPQLDPALRAEVAACTLVEVRRAFMARTDLSAAEVAQVVDGETRSTVLVQVASETTSSKLLAALSTKGGLKLQQAVALNPASSDEVRLAAGRKLLTSSRLNYRVLPAVQLLLAECVPARRFALLESRSLPVLTLALPLLPGTDDVDSSAVFARALALAAEHTSSVEEFGQLAHALSKLSWLASSEQKAKLAELMERVSNGHRWNVYAVSQAQKELKQPEAVQRAAFDRMWSPVLAARAASDAHEMESAALVVHSGYAGNFQSTFGLLTALALLANPVTPLELLCASVRQNQELRRRVSLPSQRNPRIDAALLATSYELDEVLLASVDVSAVVKEAAAEGFWDPRLVAHLVASGRLGPADLAKIPLSALPATMPSSALQTLVSGLGSRTSDPAWLEAALALSASFDGPLSDLVELVDCV
jgi:uncharacterized protein YdbL (DUF1318 family)